MWVGETALAHAERPGSIIHIVDELLRVELDTFVVLSEIDASNLYLNAFIVTLDQGLIPRFLEVQHCPNVFG
jgi:hypothetical protein